MMAKSLVSSVFALVCPLLLTSPTSAQDSDKPVAVPLFSNVERGPAFMLHCVNTGPVAAPVFQVIREMALRVDGTVHTLTGAIGGVFAGGEPILEPMQTWRIMVGLRQGNTGTMTADFGASIRSPWFFPLAPGRHTLAIRCLGNWSDDVEFYWESATIPER